MNNPNCGSCCHLNFRGFCNLTACAFPTGTGSYAPKPRTNGDFIRAMNDYEMAEWLTNFVVSSVKQYSVARGAMYTGKLAEWLGTEAENDHF